MFKVQEILKILEPEILKISDKINHLYNRIIEKISIDTRKDCRNSLFIPLKGEKFDAHNFIIDALKKGAIILLTEKDIESNLPFIKVKSSLNSLGLIAKAYIKRNNIKTVAITGTSGKTTLKEMIGYLTKFPVPEKSFNNLIGVPLTVLEKGQPDQYLILEFGTNKKGEILALTELAQPEYAVITNIGFAHTEGFGDIYNYVDEKIHILKSEKLKKAIVNWDNEFLKDKLNGFYENKLIKVTSADIFDYRQNFSGSEYKIRLKDKIYNVKSKLLGFHNALNFLICLNLIEQLGLNIEEAIENFKYFTPVEMRFELIKSSKGYFIINDCYNANFESFKASIKTLSLLPKNGKKIIVAGDMLELGKYSEMLHKKLSEIISNSDTDLIVCHGNHIKVTYENLKNSGKKKYFFNDRILLIKFLKSLLCENDIVLFKASRRLRFEKIIEEIK